MNFNLEEIAEHLEVHIKSKNKESLEDAKLRRLKDLCLFISTIFFILVIFISCVLFIALKPDSPFIGIALNGIIGIGMALAGYYVRGKTN